MLLKELLLIPAQNHGRVQVAASAQHSFAKMRAVLKLAQVGPVAGGHHGDIRENTPCQGTDQPVVMAMDDIGVEIRCRLCQNT